MTLKIQYVVGDATAPDGDGTKVILHVVNDRGGWGRGFVLAISKRWKGPEAQYRALHAQGKLKLGVCPPLVQVEPGLYVANCCAQRGYSTPWKPALDYDALRECLAQVRSLVGQLGVPGSIHCPRIGTGLGGGEWDLVEGILQEELTEQGVPVTVYDLES